MTEDMKSCNNMFKYCNAKLYACNEVNLFLHLFILFIQICECGVSTLGDILNILGWKCIEHYSGVIKYEDVLNIRN